MENKIQKVMIVAAVGIMFLYGCEHKVAKEKNNGDSTEFFKEIDNLSSQENAEVTSEPTQNMETSVKVQEPAPAVVPLAFEKPTIENIQKALKNSNFYQGKIDGVLGPKTKKGIEAFQSQNGLKVDGKVGPKTWEKLRMYAQSSSAVALQPDAAASTEANQGTATPQSSD